MTHQWNRAAVLACWALAGCAPAVPGGPPDAGADGGSPFSPAAHRPMPQVPRLGNGIIPAPRLVTIVTPQDPDAARLRAFGDELVQGAWFDAFAAEYGLSRPRGHVFLTGPAPGSFPTGMLRADVQSYLAQVIAAHPEVPLDGASVWLFYLPPGLAFDPSQSTAAGHHFPLAGANGALGDVGAAVMRKPNVADPLQWLTMIASHEFVEAITDSGGGWGRLSGDGWLLELDGGAPWTASAWVENEGSGKSELADLCDGTRVTLAAGAYQRIFSNREAAKNGDPCVPASSVPYFNLATSQDWYPGTPGGTVSVEVTGWSTAPVDDWEVEATIDGPPTLPACTAQLLSARTLTNGTRVYPALNNGDTASLSVTIPAGAASGWWGVVLLNSRHLDPAQPGRSLADEDVLHQAVVGVYLP